MPKYFYTAKSIKGEEKSGSLEAKDLHQLSQMLHSQGFILLKADLQQHAGKDRFNIALPGLGVPLAEKMFFARNLQVMIAAGLPLPRAVKALSKQVKNPRLQKALEDIVEKITRGQSLSESMEHYPEIFPELFRSMVKIGEESGTLEKVLHTLTMQMEKEHTLKSRVASAMIYPAIIICAMIAVGALMLVMVVPKLAETFGDLDIELPASTKIVVGFGTFLARNWLLAFVAAALLMIVFSKVLKTEPVKKAVDDLLLKIPVFSPIIKSTNSAYLVRNLSSLIGAGISLPKALEISSDTLGNYHFQESVKQAAEEVRKGGKLSEALRNYKNVYPPIVMQMISVGEETGETSRVLSELADFFEEEVSNATRNLAAVIEPMLMIIIGITIGFFAISMVQPMYSMLGNI